MPPRDRAFSSSQRVLGEAAPISSSVAAGLSSPCCLGSDPGLGQRWAVFLKARYPASGISERTTTKGMIHTIVERNGHRRVSHLPIWT